MCDISLACKSSLLVLQVHRQGWVRNNSILTKQSNLRILLLQYKSRYALKPPLVYDRLSPVFQRPQFLQHNNMDQSFQNLHFFPGCIFTNVKPTESNHRLKTITHSVKNYHKSIVQCENTVDRINCFQIRSCFLMTFLTQFSRQLIYSNLNGNSSMQSFLLVERVQKCGKIV